MKRNFIDKILGSSLKLFQVALQDANFFCCFVIKIIVRNLSNAKHAVKQVYRKQEFIKNKLPDGQNRKLVS